MGSVSYFEINGRVYSTSIPSPSTSPSSFRGAPTKLIPMSIGGPERTPSVAITTTRWDDTEQKRRQAREDYGWGGATWGFR